MLLLAQPTATEALSHCWLTTLTQSVINLVVSDPVVSSLFSFPSPPCYGGERVGTKTLEFSVFLTLVGGCAGLAELLNIPVRDELPGSQGKRGNERNLRL